MSKNVVRSIVAVGLAAIVLAFTHSALAGEKKLEKKTGDLAFEGVISAIDIKAGTVTVEKKPGTMTFQTDRNTKFYVHEKSTDVKLSDFKVANKVTVLYTDEGGTLVCNVLAEKGSHFEKKERKGE